MSDVLISENHNLLFKIHQEECENRPDSCGVDTKTGHRNKEVVGLRCDDHANQECLECLDILACMQSFMYLHLKVLANSNSG